MTHERAKQVRRELVEEGCTISEIAEAMNQSYEHTSRALKKEGLKAKPDYAKTRVTKYDVLLFCVQRHLNGIQTDKLQAMEGTGGSEKTVNAVFSDVEKAREGM